MNEANKMRRQFNGDQIFVVEQIEAAFNSTNHSENKLFFIDAPGGTGKNSSSNIY